jgi:deoxycytidylate deaminase
MASKNLDRYLSRATDESLESDMAYRVGACLVSSGKIISEGHNDNVRTRYGKKNIPSVHAEMSSLYKLSRIKPQYWQKGS